MDNAEPVAFVSIELGDDLVVSFFLVAADDPSDGRSLTLLRSVKWENLLPEWGRGVWVSDEALPEQSHENNLLERIRIGSSKIEVEATRFSRVLDVSRIGKSDLEAIASSLRKMNFDDKFSLQIV